MNKPETLATPEQPKPGSTLQMIDLSIPAELMDALRRGLDLAIAQAENGLDGLRDHVAQSKCEACEWQMLAWDQELERLDSLSAVLDAQEDLYEVPAPEREYRKGVKIFCNSLREATRVDLLELLRWADTQGFLISFSDWFAFKRRDLERDILTVRDEILSMEGFVERFTAGEVEEEYHADAPTPTHEAPAILQ